MRVISGTAGGIPLHTPKSDIRPTMDRVKAAIFSSLAASIPGASILDLFAGSGALGIEALSRGAAKATFVENNPAAIQTIEKNLSKTRLGGSVQGCDVFSFLDRSSLEEEFDIVFADPPYAKRAGERDFTAELLANAALRRVIKRDGVFVLEKLPGAPLPATEWWQAARRKAYGATEVVFLLPSELKP